MQEGGITVGFILILILIPFFEKNYYSNLFVLTIHCST
jgi:hypothetical protein